MGIFFVYILKSSFSLALFYLFYRLLLNRDTFHRFNRIMLLALIAISAILPLISTTVEHPTQINHSFMTIEDMLMMQSMVVVSNENAPSAPLFTWYEIVVMIYWLGLIFFMLRNVWSIFKIVQLIRGGRTVEDNDGVRVIVHDKKIPPFSWLKFILISQKDFNDNCADILIHEKAHISRHHSYDIILADIFIFIQWFNPAAWLLKQELKNIHEYEADDMVLKSGVDAKEYQLLLIQKAVGPRLYSIANNFNHSSLKKRITMMLKKKSNPWARMKYIYVLPVAAIAVTAFARPEVNDELNRLSEVKISEVSSSIQESGVLPKEIVEATKEIIEEVDNVTTLSADEKKPIRFSLRVIDDEKKPIPGASVIVEGSNNGTLTDKNGKFSIEANEGEVLCISYVGKETLRFPVKEKMQSLKLNLMMFDQINNVSEMVVVGYGNTKEDNSQSNNDKKVLQVTGTDGKIEIKRSANDDEPIFMVVEDMPEFPGGMQKCLEYMGKNVRYPAKAQKDKIEGKVIVQFVVSKDGTIRDPFVVRSVSPELDEEAIRVIKGMPKWKPGRQRNVNVDVKYTIPVTFRLVSEKKEGEVKNMELSVNKDIHTVNLYSRNNRNPLFIADGKVISSEQMELFNTSSIESISVNKDAESLKDYILKYGDKAKNGVVLITTKKK